MKRSKILSKGILFAILFSTQTLFGGEIEAKKTSFESFYKTHILKGAESSALVLNGNYAPTPQNAPMTQLRADGVIEKIDSVVVVNEIGKLKKEEFSYSDQGYLIKFRASTYENGTWVIWSGHDFEYDAQGKQTASIVYEGFIPATSSWYLGQKYEYAYDENGFVSKTTISTMSDSPWVKAEELDLKNNEQGLIMEGIASAWNNDVKIPVSKTIYNYDEDGDMILNEQSRWENDDWVNTIKQAIIDDPDHLCVENYDWNGDYGDWLGLNRQELKFLLTEDGKRGESTYETLSDFVNGQFRVFIEVRSTYDDDNLLILQETRSNMVNNNPELPLQSRQTFTYGPLNEFEGFEAFEEIAVQREGILESFRSNGSSFVELKDIVLFINGDVAARTSYLWNGATEEWTGRTRSTYVPGTVSNPVFTNTDYEWNPAIKKWVPVRQTIETKVSLTGARTGLIGKAFNPAYNTDNTIEPLLNVNQYTYEYGEDDVLIRQENFAWNGSTNQWRPRDGKEQVFEYSISIDQIYGPTSLLADPYYFKSKPLEIKQLGVDGNEFFAAETLSFYYSGTEGTDIPTIQNNNHAKAFFVDNTLTVETQEVETISVYSLSGSLLFSAAKVEGSAHFDTPLVSGVYIVKGSTGWAVKTIK